VILSLLSSSLSSAAYNQSMECLSAAGRVSLFIYFFLRAAAAAYDVCIYNYTRTNELESEREKKKEEARFPPRQMKELMAAAAAAAAPSRP